MNKQQQMQEILKDTVDYYRKDPEGRRAVDGDDGSCMYTTDGGLHCAIGRYMKPEFQTIEFVHNTNTSIAMLNRELDYYLVSKALGLEDRFWADLQDFHDSRGNWRLGLRGEDEPDLSEHGKARYVHFQDKIARGLYDD